MKILMFSDMQARGNDFNWRNQQPFTSRMTEIWSTFKMAAWLVRTQKPDVVVCLGDVFDVHSLLEVPCIDLVMGGFELIQEQGEHQLFIVSGNHDLAAADGSVSSALVLRDLPNTWVVAGAPAIVNDMGFIPYVRDLTVQRE